MSRYRFGELLGEGAVAKVYRGMDLSMNREVAIKVLKAGVEARAPVRQRFLREARAAARLNHPNIVRVFDFGELDGRNFLALELVTGRTLEAVLAADPPLEERVRLLERIARGVHHAHENGVIHRDLKPANILVDESGEPKVADFGLAHLGEGEAALTRTGAALGTPLYMSPEQVAGRAKDVTPRSDVYALGAILYEALAGRPPHDARSLAELSVQILQEAPRPPGRLRPGIPADLETVCLKALEKDPRHRYASAEAFANDLQRHLDGRSVAARPPGPGARAVRSLRRHKVAVAAGLVAAAILLASATLVLRQREASDRESAASRRLAALASAVGERNRDLRRLKKPPEAARADLERAVADLDAYLVDRPGDPAGIHVRALGRLYLGDVDRAEREIREVLARHPEFLPGWTLLGMAKLEQCRAALWGDPAGLDSRLGRTRALLQATLDAFAKGRGTAREEEAQRWGLPLTRDDEVMERLARAFEAAYVEGRPDEGRRLLEEGTKEYRAEEYALYLGMWAGPDRGDLEWLDRAVEWAPGYAEALLLRGSRRQAAGLHQGARADFDQALRIRPDCVEALVNRASDRIRTGDLDGALADCARALELRPDLPQAHNNRGAALLHRGDGPGALEAYERSLRIRPDPGVALIGRGLARAAMGDHERALADFDRVLEGGGEDADLRFHRGNSLAKKGDLPGAIAEYDRAITLRKDFPSALINRAVLKWKRRDGVGAKADYDRALELEPDHLEARLGRGHVRQQTGDLEGALADFTRVVELKPDHAEAMNQRGVLKAMKGDTAGAIEEFDRSLRIQEANSSAHFNRAIARTQLGDVPGALADYDRAIELRPAFPDAYANRGAIRQQRGDSAGAIEDYRKALQYAPEGWPIRGQVEAWLRHQERK